MEEGYTGKSTSTSTRMENGVTTKTVTTTLTKPDGTTKTIEEVTVTQRDGSTSTRTSERTVRGTGSSGGSSAPSGWSNAPSGWSNAPSGWSSTPSGGSSNPSSGSAQPTDLKTFRAEALKSHNDRRSRHGSPALKLSNELNDYAQKWADHLMSTGQFQHSDCQMGDKRLGENIANMYSSAATDYTGEAVTEQWYSEISKHDYNRDHQPGTGHFTQVVWKDTKEMGIGKATNGSGKFIVVASYLPAGNLLGSWSKNVFPPK